MKKVLLSFAALFTSGLALSQADCSELFISEYVEGWSNNKALEIYNPTANSINLSQYIVIRYSNGATTATSSYAVQLQGTIPAYGTHVGVVDLQDPNGTGQDAPVWDSLIVKANAFYSPDYNTNSTWYWNGDDAVVLAKGSTSDISNAVAVDIFGKIGEDPGTGWTSQFPYNNGLGNMLTADHSLIRKAAIKKGETNPLIPFFNALDQWDSISAVIPRLDQNGDTMYNQGGNMIVDGNWASLGKHTCDCYLSLNEKQNEEIKIYPNPTNGIIYIKNADAIEEIEIINALGQTIIAKKVNNSPVLTFNLGDNKGVYFVRMKDANNSTTVKRIIVK